MPVAMVVGSLAGGMSREEVVQEYELTAEQVAAALRYATELIAATGAMPLARV